MRNVSTHKLYVKNQHTCLYFTFTDLNWHKCIIPRCNNVIHILFYYKKKTVTISHRNRMNWLWRGAKKSQLHFNHNNCVNCSCWVHPCNFYETIASDFRHKRKIPFTETKKNGAKISLFSSFLSVLHRRCVAIKFYENVEYTVNIYTSVCKFHFQYRIINSRITKRFLQTQFSCPDFVRRYRFIVLLCCRLEVRSYRLLTLKMCYYFGCFSLQ